MNLFLWILTVIFTILISYLFEGKTRRLYEAFERFLSIHGIFRNIFIGVVAGITAGITVRALRLWWK
jgi:hypothetical protein